MCPGMYPRIVKQMLTRRSTEPRQLMQAKDKSVVRSIAALTHSTASNGIDADGRNCSQLSARGFLWCRAGSGRTEDGDEYEEHSRDCAHCAGLSDVCG